MGGSSSQAIIAPIDPRRSNGPHKDIAALTRAANGRHFKRVNHAAGFGQQLVFHLDKSVRNLSKPTIKISAAAALHGVAKTPAASIEQLRGVSLARQAGSKNASP